MNKRKKRIHALVIALFLSLWVCPEFTGFKSPPVIPQENGLQFSCSFSEIDRSHPHMSCPSLETALTSSRADGLPKDGPVCVTEGFPSALSQEVFTKSHKITLAYQTISPPKVPIHLINSILTI